MAKRTTRRATTATLEMPTVAVLRFQHLPNKRIVEEHGHQPHLRVFRGELTLNGKPQPFEAKIISNGTMTGLLPGMKGKWTASAEVGTGDGYCRTCNGNWGTSDPETPGMTAKAVAEALLPKIEALGFPIYRYDRAGGWSMFEMKCAKLGEREGTTRRRFYVATLVKLDCPVCGVFEQKESEPGI